MKSFKTVLAGALVGVFASISAANAASLPGRGFTDSGDACNEAGCGDMTWAQIADASPRAPSGGSPLQMSPFLRYEIARDPGFPNNDGNCHDLDTPTPATFASPRIAFQGQIAVERFSTNITFDVGLDGRIQSDPASAEFSNGTVWYAMWLIPVADAFPATPNHFGYVIGSGKGTNSVFGRASTSGSVNVVAPQAGPTYVTYKYLVITYRVPSPAPLFVVQRSAACSPRLLLTSGFDFGPSPFGEQGPPAPGK